VQKHQTTLNSRMNMDVDAEDVTQVELDEESESEPEEPPRVVVRPPSVVEPPRPAQGQPDAGHVPPDARPVASPPCVILSVYSHKGGVGKTTLVDAIGNSIFPNQSGAQLNFKRCLMIDLDPQMNLTCKIQRTEENFEEYINSLIDITDLAHNQVNSDVRTKLTRLTNRSTSRNIHPNPLRVRSFTNRDDAKDVRFLDLIPGYPELDQLTRQMTVELEDHRTPINICHAIQDLIAEYCTVFGYDLVILDLGPDLYILNNVALWSSNYVLIPCTADIYSTMSFRLLAEKIFPPAVGPIPVPPHPFDRFHSNLQVIGFLPNRVKVHKGAPTKPMRLQIDKLHSAFQKHLQIRCVDRARSHPCFIEHLQGDIYGKETEHNLFTIPIRTQPKKTNFLKQLSDLVRWLQGALVPRVPPVAP
jgi:cellulose biosynthesis protein BcsQ